jgi:hypothetical protein
MLSRYPTCGWKAKRYALDEIAARQGAADEEAPEGSRTAAKGRDGLSSSGATVIVGAKTRRPGFSPDSRSISFIVDALGGMAVK